MPGRNQCIRRGQGEHMSNTDMEDIALGNASNLKRDMRSVGVRWQKLLAQAFWIVAVPSMFASIGNAAEQYCRMPGSQ